MLSFSFLKLSRVHRIIDYQVGRNLEDHLVLFQFAEDSVQNDMFIESNWLPLGSKRSAFPDVKTFACHASGRGGNYLAQLSWAPVTLSCGARHTQFFPVPATVQYVQSCLQSHGTDHCQPH